MIPLWQMGPAIAAGNAFILKPSERDPSVPVRIAELFLKAGLPAGILNVVHGDKEAVDVLLTDERVRAIGFVGSTPIAEYIYTTGERARQARPVLRRRRTTSSSCPTPTWIRPRTPSSAPATARRERCMAISVAVPVGEETADALAAKLAERVAALKVGPSLEPGMDYGPLVTAPRSSA
jgi:malonate-semialdehyde dehydrogenase (acetylating)/methylmalonate-semialdehyde dehydrogenase